MRRRTCAALLCGPLVAGCGTATRVDFASHSRPATPVEVSVVIDHNMPLQMDPSHVSPGPAIFDVLNQTTRPTRFLIREHGQVTRTPAIAPGSTAQIKADVSPGTTLGTFSATLRSTMSTSTSLAVSGRARNGNNSLLQPRAATVIRSESDLVAETRQVSVGTKSVWLPRAIDNA